MSAAEHTPVGFLGLGHMGEPMATRLADSGVPLRVWNRTAEKAERLRRRGALPAGSPGEVFEHSDVVILMLANGAVVDEVLARGEHGFGVDVNGRTVVNMGTVHPSYSAALGAQLAEHGAAYVEAPVSGSRVPAENGELVAMIAGDPTSVEAVETLLVPMTAARFRCGAVPRALETKLAVNVFLITMVTGLAESVAYAERCGADVDVLRRILDAGPMSSPTSRIKLAKLLDGDLSAQASVSDVLYNCRTIVEAADDHRARLPLLSVCEGLFAAAETRGLGDSDMISVVDAVRASLDPSASE